MVVQSLSSRLISKLGSTDELLSLVVPILAEFDLLPSHPDLTARYGTLSSIDYEHRQNHSFLNRQLGLVQQVVLEKVWVEWENTLQDEGVDLGVLEGLFVPPPPPTDSDKRSQIYAEVAISSYGVITSLLSPSRRKAPLHRRTLEIMSSLLVKLSRTYNIATLFENVFTSQVVEDERERTKTASRWGLIVRDLVGIPTRIANAWGEHASTSGASLVSLPMELTTDSWFATLSQSYEQLLWTQSLPTQSQLSQVLASTLSSLSSFFPFRTNSPSFFTAVLPALIPYIIPPPFPAPAETLLRRARYTQSWRMTVNELSPRESRKFVEGLFAAVQNGILMRELSGKGRRAARFLLSEIIGPLTPEDEDTSIAWDTGLSVLLDHSRNWSGELAKVAIDWAGESSEETKVELLKKVMEVWSSKDSIKDGSDTRRIYLTTFLLHSIYSLPPLHPSIVDLSRSPDFITSISSHLGLMRPTVRLLGMLAAEEVSARASKDGEGVPRLNFGDIWEGDEVEKVVCRQLREGLMEEKGSEDGWTKLLVEIWGAEKAPSTSMSTPATMKTTSAKLMPKLPTSGIAPQPSKRPLISVVDGDDADEEFRPMNLPPAPSSSFLDTLNTSDPSLYATTLPSGKSSTTRQRGKLRAPVYIPELTAYLRGKDPDVADSKEDAEEEAERVEMGLKEAEKLIRRKMGWGGELEENAVDLTFVLIGLQNQFELDEFDESKQAALIALVRAVPTKVAPAIIEQYFTSNYSIQQRNIMLTALALGARELAGLPLPRLLPTSKSPSIAPPPPAPPIDLFPSKRLPPALHQRLIGQQTPPPPPVSLAPGALEQISEDLTRAALSDAKEDAETTIPEAAREKLLTISSRRFASAPAPTTNIASFAPYAGEFFVMPLINRFWLYLKDSEGSKKGPYAGGANSASLLDPIVLSRYISTLSVLLHASRHSPHFLAVLVPEAIQLMLALRSPMQEVDKAILESQLELILTAVDGSVALDVGNTLMRTGEVVGEVKDWAEEVFVIEEKRGGENGIGRAGRAAAGILLRVEEILDKWRGKVGW